jgi:putative Mg2+ transporter-C (MgtC) family protein
MDIQPQFQLLGEIVVAMILGGILGFERELADRPAGLRTHILVAGAAAMLVGLGDVLVARVTSDAGRPQMMQSDPIRVVEAIITGISFLGAGTIFRRRSSERVEGLTTAASILMAAAIGIAVALQQWVLAVSVTFLGLICLRGLGMVERLLGVKTPPKQQGKVHGTGPADPRSSSSNS